MIRSKTAGVHSAPARIFSFIVSSILPSHFFAGVAIFAGLFSFAVPAAQAGAFTPGNLVVVQSDGQTSAAASISLLEYQTSGGSAVNTVTIPSASATTAPANAALTQSGSATSEGFLNRSQDGRYLFVVGYNLTVGTASANGTSADRVVGRIDSLGNVDTTTRAPGYSGNNIRTAVSDTGGLIYVAGPGAGLTSLNFGAQPASTNVINSGNTRFAGIFGSQLYAIGSIGTLGRVGAGLPTNTATFTALSAAIGSTSANQFFFLDRDANVAGVDLCYVADGSSGIKKYSFDGTSWTARGTNTGTFFGLVAAANGSGTDIYATTGTGASAGNTLVKINDSAAYTNTASFGTATTLATAPSGKAFRGLAFSPVGPTIVGAATATAFTTTYGTASAAQSFSISGSLLTADITATAPPGFEVSSDGTNYGATATFTQTGGSASGSLRVRMKANAAVSGTYNSQNIVLSSAGASNVNIVTASTGNAVTAKALTITAKDQAVIVGPALTNVTGSTLFTPTGLANGETVGSVSLDFGGRGAVAGTFTGAILPSAATGGTFAAANYTITYVAGTLNVSAAAVPTISSGGTLSSLSTTYGTASTSTGFTVSGADMTAAITVTPPSGFEVSTDNATFASSVTVGAAGTFGSTTVYVRISASATAGTKTGNISLTSSGATAVNVAVASSTVAAKSLTGSFTAANKSYDGTITATVIGRSLTGVVGSDDVTLTGGTAAFDSAGAGTGKAVTLSGATLGGTTAGNYTLGSVATTTAEISKASQTITFSSIPSLPISALPFTPSAVASSGLAVSFASSDSSVATASGSTVQIVGPGTCTITASQAGDDNYNPASDVQRSFTVNPSGTINFDGTTYSQDFQSMGAGGSSSVLPTTMTELVQLSGGTTNLAGWFIYGSGWTGAANKWVGTDSGTSTTGGFRQMIDNNSPVGRALGSQGSSSAEGFFGVVLKNTSGKTLNVVNLSYDAVMNRNPATTANSYPMSFLVIGTNISTGSGAGTFDNAAGTWINGTGFTTPTSGSGSPGTNSTGTTNTQAAISPLFKISTLNQTLTNLNWSNGAFLYIRWQEKDEGGSDATAGVDNFSIDAKLPVPTIGSLSPSSVVPGGSDFNLTINGGNFYPETEVTVAGVSKTVTYVNSGQLTVPITATEIATGGSLAVVVRNPATGGGGGTVSASLAVNSGPSLSLVPPADNSAFASTIQTSTAPRTFTVSGSSLTSGITISAPSGFEVSTDDQNYTSSLLVPPVGGNVSATTLYVRFNPAAVQSYSGSITAATAGVSPSASFPVSGTATIPNEGKLFGTFADGTASLTATAPAVGNVDEYIVLAKVGSPITDVPSGNGSAYTASATFGAGTQIGASFVVYKGSEPPSLEVTGLTNGLRYYFSMFSRVATAYSTPNSTNGFPAGTLNNVITQWSFNDANNLTSPSTGVGSFTFTGTITNAVSASGSSTDSGSPNTAASTSGYPASSANTSSGTSGVVFNASTAGKQNIVVYWDVRPSNTASRYSQFQYSTDGGATWNNFIGTGGQTESGLYVGNTGDTWFLQRKADLSAISAVNNNANFAFRIVTVFAPGTSAYATANTGSSYSSNGTLRYDMVTVTGTDAATQTPYDSWAALFSLTGADAVGTADPDKDGMDNNAEFAFGTSPVSGGSRAATMTTAAGSIKLTWLQRSGVTYTVKSLPDLATAFDSGTTMTTAASIPQPSGLPSGYTQYETSLSTSSSRGFLRVRATQP